MSDYIKIKGVHVRMTERYREDLRFYEDTPITMIAQQIRLVQLSLKSLPSIMRNNEDWRDEYKASIHGGETKYSCIYNANIFLEKLEKLLRDLEEKKPEFREKRIKKEKEERESFRRQCDLDSVRIDLVSHFSKDKQK